MMCSGIKNGVNGTWQFAINLFNGSLISYIFDMRNSQFIIDNIGSKQQLRFVPFHATQLKNISGAIKWLGIRGIDNTDLLLVFLFEQRTRKYYLVTMRDNGETINVVYEHFIYVERIVELTQSFVIKDENEHLYAVISWQIGDTHPKTSLHVLRINVSPQSGMITTRIVMDRSVNGNWFRPFIFENHIILRAGITHCLSCPLRRTPKSPSEDSSPTETVEPSIHAINTVSLICNPNSAFFGPVLYKDLALHYIYDAVVNEGQLWAFHWRSSLWRSTKVILTRHALNKFVTMYTINDMLYMHGDCATTTCHKRAHIHCVDLSNKFL
uniref:DPPIV_N domain-containing protein n=1 Tax=Ascaris lumbricoides TaxID=6252 RepID=A0A0M3I8F5_ASCLU